MRLARVREALEQKKIQYDYAEEDGCGSIDFLFRGLSYHIWEYHDGAWGVETNVFDAGRTVDLEGDYEEKIAALIDTWPFMLV